MAFGAPARPALECAPIGVVYDEELPHITTLLTPPHNNQIAAPAVESFKDKCQRFIKGTNIVVEEKSCFNKERKKNPNKVSFLPRPQVWWFCVQSLWDGMPKTSKLADLDRRYWYEGHLPSATCAPRHFGIRDAPYCINQLKTLRDEQNAFNRAMNVSDQVCRWHREEFCTVGSFDTNHSEWIMDTGASRDLVGRQNMTDTILDTVHPVPPVTLITAKGKEKRDQAVSVPIPSLDETADALLMENSPNALTVGKRCTKGDYSFYWPNWRLNKPPIMYNVVNDFTISLDVRNDVPFLNASGLWTLEPAETWLDDRI